METLLSALEVTMPESVRKTLLLVEDEALLAMTEKMQLEKYGYAVKTEDTGEKAVEAVGQFPGIDLVLMDINLGKGIDGTEAAEIILKDHDIPIVFLSSHSEREIVEKTEKITSYGYVVKSSSITVLDASIKMAFKLFEAKKKEREKETALIQSEEKYRLISENTSDGIVHFSSDGLIDYASPSYLRQIGYSELKEFGKGFDAILLEIHPDDRDTIFSSIDGAIENKKEELTYTYRVRHANGHFIWREDHSSFMYDSSGAYLGAYVSCRDITDRKKIENKLIVLGKAIEASPAIIVITDAKGTIEYVNPRFTSITGYSSEEVIGKNPRILKSGKTDENVYVDLWNTLTSGNEWKGFFKNKKKNGEFYNESATIAPVKNLKGETTNYIAVKEDLTERKFMQESLEESNIRFNTLAGSQSVLIWESGIDKLCTYFNPTWLSFTGKKIEDELGNGWAGGVHPDDLERCLSIYAEAFNERKEFSMEYRLLKANGEYGWVFDHGCPKYHDKEFIGYIGSCVDVSQNKKYENILRESEEKYRLLHEYAGVGIGYYNPDGIVLSYNQLAAKYMGGVPEDFIGKSIFDLFPKSDADLYFERIKRAAASEASVVYEDIVPLPTGNMYFLSTFTKILDISGSLLGIQIISQDISKQKDLENELQIKEARYRKAQEVAHVGSWEYDIHTDKFWGSEEGKRIYGFTLTTDNFTANDVMNCVIEKEKVNQAMIDLIDKNVPYNIEFTIIPHNSTERKTISSIAELVKDEQGNPIKVEGVMQDVTLSKKISEALENSEYMYRTLANTGQALIWTSGKDKLCDYFNKTWLNFTGRTLEQELGNGWTEGVHPDDFQHCLEIYTEAFDRREIFSMEYRIRRHDGEYRWLIDEGCPRYDNNSRFIGYIGHCLDITERKKSEQAVWEYGELYRSIMNASPDTIIITNMESRILMTSPKALAMFDCKEEELLNHLITDFITPEDQDLASLNVDQMFKGLISKLIEFRVFRADGTYFILEANMEFICDSNKQPIQIVFILRNISERKQAEERIKTLLAEKELILKEVHHRIKNNMSTMMSLLSLQAGNAKSDFARIALQDAEKRMQSMGILYDKLYRSADFKMLSVKEYISALVDDILSNFPNKNIVTVNKSIQDFVLDANRLQPIGIIINELLTNIMKYAFRGRENGLISVSATNVYGHVAISIQDDGSGIPSSVSFENSKGFGLQLVQALTHQLDGTITIERGNGTKIIVEFEK